MDIKLDKVLTYGERLQLLKLRYFFDHMTNAWWKIQISTFIRLMATVDSKEEVQHAKH